MRQHILQLDQLKKFNQWVADKSQQQNPKTTLSNVYYLHKNAPTFNQANRSGFKFGFFDHKKPQPSFQTSQQNLDKQNILKQPPTLVCANCGDISHNSTSCGKPNFKPSKR